MEAFASTEPVAAEYSYLKQQEQYVINCHFIAHAGGVSEAASASARECQEQKKGESGEGAASS